MTEPKELATRAAPKTAASIALVESGFQLKTLDDAYRFSQAVVASRLAPKDDTAETVMIKLQAGAELGLSPMRALSVLVVVNGKLSIQGDGVLALCRASGKFSKLRTWNEGAGDDRAGCLEFVRTDTGETDIICFTWADAKRAGLATKQTYKDYGDDMMIWKAVSRFGKRYASDVCMGIDVTESVQDHRPMIPAVIERPALPPADESNDPLFDAAFPDSVQPTELTEAAKGLFPED